MHEKELDMIFGTDTDAKTSLDQLKEQIDEANKPEVLKEPINDKAEEIKTEVEDKTEDSISSHNSSRIVEEKPIASNVVESTITNNSTILENELPISTKNAEEVHTNTEIDDISSHNFVEEKF